MSRRREKVLSEDEGLPLLVLRPKSPERAKKAMEDAHALVGRTDPEAKEAFQAIFHENRDEYTFVGWFARDLRTGRFCIVGEDDRYVGELEPGDSFVVETEESRKARMN